MESHHLVRASILMLVLVISFILCLELYWRSSGFTPSYNDDKILWAMKRKEVYESAEKATVFGGSRIKFDLDIPTWERSTGEKAIQLAIVATPARLILRDLANDRKFKGKLIIDVADFQFFSIDTVRRDKFAREALQYYYNETPAQKMSGLINYELESNLVFLEEGAFGLNSLLNDLRIPNRAGVVIPGGFPKELLATSSERQNSMTPMFLASPLLQKRQKEVLKKGFISTMNKTPAIKGGTLNALLDGLKTSIDKIRSRGGLVMFVRPPSSGDILESEIRIFARQHYWDRLLAYTNTPGIHFSDYSELANFECPEWPRLSPTDAATYTAQLVKILNEEKGWIFPKKINFNADNVKK